MGSTMNRVTRFAAAVGCATAAMAGLASQPSSRAKADTANNLDEKRKRVLRQPYRPVIEPRKLEPVAMTGVLSRAEIQDKIRANEKFVANEGAVEGYSVNCYAANDPLEDTHAVRLDLCNQPGVLAAVMDGHSGRMASYFLRDRLFDFLEALHHYFPSSSLLDPGHFEILDELYLNYKMANTKTSSHAHHGSCFVVAHVTDREVDVAWAGDCRAVVGRKTLDGTYEAVGLTRDHQIGTHPGEREKLLADHPHEFRVVSKNRVKGHLQPTRVFGDGPYKRMELFYESDRFHPFHPQWTPPYVTARPEKKRYAIQPDDEFLVLACDGLFDELHNEEVVEAVGEYLRAEPEGRKEGEDYRAGASSHLIQRALLAAGEYKFGRADCPEDTLTKVLNLRSSKRRKVHDDITVIVLFLDKKHGKEGESLKEISQPDLPDISPLPHRRLFRELKPEA